jgi:hypothetical protein
MAVFLNSSGLSLFQSFMACKGCCQTNAHQPEFSSNLNFLGCAEAAPLGKSVGTVQLEI